jgi:hypothetical protein
MAHVKKGTGVLLLAALVVDLVVIATVFSSCHAAAGNVLFMQQVTNFCPA